MSLAVLLGVVGGSACTDDREKMELSEAGACDARAELRSLLDRTEAASDTGAGVQAWEFRAFASSGDAAEQAALEALASSERHRRGPILCVLAYVRSSAVRDAIMKLDIDEFTDSEVIAAYLALAPYDDPEVRERRDALRDGIDQEAIERSRSR